MDHIRPVGANHYTTVEPTSTLPNSAVSQSVQQSTSSHSAGSVKTKHGQTRQNGGHSKEPENEEETYGNASAISAADQR